MTRNSLKARILKYLRPRGWVNGGEIERLAMQAKYKSSNASRRLRELADRDGKIKARTGVEPLLDAKEENGSVWYRYKQPTPYTMSLITNQTVK